MGIKKKSTPRNQQQRPKPETPAGTKKKERNNPATREKKYITTKFLRVSRPYFRPIAAIDDRLPGGSIEACRE